MRGTVLLLAAGEGTRLGNNEPKAFLDIAGEPLICRAFRGVMAAELVDGVVVAAPPGYERRMASLVPSDGSRPVTVVAGGETRQSSACLALAAAPDDTEAILVHDAARVCTSPSLFDDVLRALDHAEAACPARAVVDTIKVAANGVISSTLDRSSLVSVETPQGVRAGLYRRALAAAEADGFVGTDDVSLVERLGVGVTIVPSVLPNIKITFPEDVALVESMLEGLARGAGR